MNIYPVFRLEVFPEGRGGEGWWEGLLGVRLRGTSGAQQTEGLLIIVVVILILSSFFLRGAWKKKNKVALRKRRRCHILGLFFFTSVLFLKFSNVLVLIRIPGVDRGRKQGRPCCAMLRGSKRSGEKDKKE